VTAAAHPGAYVHIPFCAHRCAYCSFVALEGRSLEADYFDALVREVVARRGETEAALDTVYFGGGTPSYVDPKGLASVLSALRESFGLDAAAEVTAEANPDDIDEELLVSLATLGINRLSIGVQSLADDELPYLERRHDAAAARKAISRAVSIFGNVSADLMIGIPGQTQDSLAASVEGILDLGVTHLSAYLLEIEKAPKLIALKKECPDLFPEDDEAAERWEAVDTLATARGLPRYEHSNWARPGSESRHNLKYWTGEPTLGFGVSAHSFDGAARRANTGATAEYVRLARERGTAFATESRLDAASAARERVLLGLRLAKGVPEREFDAVASTLSREDRERLGDCEEAGLLERRDDRVRLTRSGVLLSNEVFSILI